MYHKLITDRKDWSTEEILDTKDPIHFAVRPQLHWTGTKIRVHIFCCLLGLMLTCLLRKELMNKGIKIENDKLIEHLSEIRETYILNPNKNKKSGFEAKKVLEENSLRGFYIDVFRKLTLAKTLLCNCYNI